VSAGVLIIGAGLAGMACAEALRTLGFAEPITVAGEEPHAPYDRPPLCKDILLGKRTAEQLAFHPPQWYAEKEITLLTGSRVERLEKGAHRTVVLATGCSPRRLPGAADPRIVYLRSREDGLALKASLASAPRVAVLGAGLIGMEVAAAARQLGCAVTVFEQAARSMARVCPQPVSAALEALHRRHGVELVFNSREGLDALAARFDLVLVAVGSVANDALARQAGLACSNGVEVDEFGRTADAAVYAIGDCAAFWHPGLQRRLRLESWHHARQHAAAVAANIAGREQSYRALPRGWTVQYDVNLIMAGEHTGAEEVAWVSEAPRIAHCLKDGVPVAAYGFNAPRQMRDAMALIEKRLAP
jgi:3-phenylpropionate/trans-cinnamate dioxygenase ferredoxin reductase subunit